MPTVPGFIANHPGFESWRRATVFAGDSLFDSARALGMTTAVIGQPDFHLLHLPPTAVDVQVPADAAAAPAALRDLLAAHPRALVVVTLGGPRTGDRHARAAIDEFTALSTAIAALTNAAGDALVIITSRGATAIDDPRADFYGAGTSRHVPLLILGPNVRPGAISGQPGAPVDLPATILFGLGAPTTTDFVTGTWATGQAVGGVPQPTPAGATAGRALVRAFALAPTP
jgi:hypothetical protein